MNTKTMKGLFTKAALVGALAGVAVFFAPTTAQAQQFAVQFGVSRPYYPPVYGPGFYAEQRRDDFIRREEFLRHERWEHERWEHERAFAPAYHGYDRDHGYDHDRGYDRDRDRDRDRDFDRR